MIGNGNLILTVAALFFTTAAVSAFIPTTSFSRPAVSLASTESEIFTVSVALTREEGKNDKMIESLAKHPTKEMLKNSLHVNVLELPVIEHAEGSDLKTFQEMAQKDPSFKEYDYIIITSPESAKVFGESAKPSENIPKIAAVGKATKKALTQQGFEVSFVPSKADGETLAEELPPANDMGLNNVLYPASEKAAETIQEMLGKRKDASFRVDRLNTYDTIPVTYNEKQLGTIIDDVHIACFGSPTSVDGWLANVDRALDIENLSDDEKKKVPGCSGNVVAVCIGSTTARRCLESGRWHANDIYYPSKNPGVQGWTDSCYSASGDVMERDFWGGGW